MPVCQNCGETFPNRVTVDGQTKVVSNRKFCLTCSPFGRHNTSKHPVQKANGRKRCPECTEMLDVSEFYKRNDGEPSSYCIRCVLKKSLDRQRALKQASVEYKGGRCVRCGYNRSLAALEFHHLDPSEKDINISKKRFLDLERLKPELDKCILVCSNCHKEIHYGTSTEIK